MSFFALAGEASGLNCTIPKGVVAPGKTFPPLEVPINGFTSAARSVCAFRGAAQPAMKPRPRRADTINLRCLSMPHCVRCVANLDISLMHSEGNDAPSRQKARTRCPSRHAGCPFRQPCKARYTLLAPAENAAFADFADTLRAYA